MTLNITTRKDPGSSRAFLRRQTLQITKPLELVIQPTDPLDRLSMRPEADRHPA